MKRARKPRTKRPSRRRQRHNYSVGLFPAMVFVLGMLLYREHLDGNSNSAVLIAVLAYLMHPVGVQWVSSGKRRKY